MTKLMTEAIRLLMDQESERAAKRRIIERMRNAPDLGTKGVIKWTREELYDR